MPPLNFFDPACFRAMLDHPARRESFTSMFPHARSLFEEYLEATAPALPKFPTDGVTALQFTLFDNGEDAQRGGKRALTMKSRFGLSVKAWDRLNIDWRKPHQIAWEASACLRGAEETLKVVEHLTSRNLLSPDVSAALEEVREMTGGEGSYGVCHQRKPGMGSRWTNVVVHVQWDGIASPEKAFLVRPDFTGYEAGVFQQQTATGASLGGRAVAQARVAFHEGLSAWATEMPR